MGKYVVLSCAILLLSDHTTISVIASRQTMAYERYLFSITKSFPQRSVGAILSHSIMKMLKPRTSCWSLTNFTNVTLCLKTLIMLQTNLPHEQYFYLSLHKTLLHMVLWAVLLPQLREKLVLIGHGVPTTLLCAAIWAGEHISGWEEANKEDTHQRFCIFFHSFKGPNYSLPWWSCFRLLLPWAPIINFAFMRSISALPLSLSVHINHMQYHKKSGFLKTPFLL